MTQYIDKDAVVAEIDERIASLESIGSENYLHDNCPEQYAMLVTLKSLKFSIDTLEVKEVDLEKYYHEFLQKEWFGNPHVRTVSEMMAFTAKHFFELGLKAKIE